MTDPRQQTIDTYNTSAKQLAEYFRGIGPRAKYIDLAFELAGNPKNARVVEVGCGDGRDAKEISKRCSWYQGFDVSSELIKLAKVHVPTAEFVTADATAYVFPDKLDVIFAFASLLHLDKNEISALLQRAHAGLRPGGIFYISLKWSENYRTEIKNDQFGTRLFYFYNAEIIQKLAGEGWEVAVSFQEIHGHTKWFETALRKKTT